MQQLSCRGCCTVEFHFTVQQFVLIYYDAVVHVKVQARCFPGFGFLFGGSALIGSYVAEHEIMKHTFVFSGCTQCSNASEIENRSV